MNHHARFHTTGTLIAMAAVLTVIYLLGVAITL